MARTFEKVNSSFVKLAVGESCEGFLRKVLDMPVQGRTRPGVMLENEKGETIKLPLGEAVREELPTLEIGAYYKFTRAQDEKGSKGNDCKKFDIFQANED